MEEGRVNPVPFISSTLEAYGFSPTSVPAAYDEESASKPAAHKDKSKLPCRAAARKIVEFLVDHDVDTFFGIPGGPITPVFEALRHNSKARLIESRHENHAVFAAQAYYRATNRTACVILTAGPGICNAITAITTAHCAKVPVLVIAGDVSNDFNAGRQIQDSGPDGLNIDLMLSPITRKQIRVKKGAVAVLQTGIALQAATDPTNPGPVLLVLPANCGFQDALELPVYSHEAREIGRAPQESVERVAALLSQAARPLIVVGGGCAPCAEKIKTLVEFVSVPFVTTPSAKGLIQEDHPLSLRNGGLAASKWALKYTSEDVDVCLVLGTDLDDVSVGPTTYIGNGGRLIHVDLDPNIFNQTLPMYLGIKADITSFVGSLHDACTAADLKNKNGARLARDIQSDLPFDVENFATDDRHPIAPHRVISDLQKSMRGKARFITDAGEHMLSALHYLSIGKNEDFNIDVSVGSMGNGIAGAVGYAVGEPGRPIVCVCGDGGMQMSGMEILTALKMSLPIVYVVFNDSRYNMIHHGMKRVFGEAEKYDTPEVDFAAWAVAMGVRSAVVDVAGQVTVDLIDSMMIGGGPILLDVRIDPDIRVSGADRGVGFQAGCDEKVK